MLSSNKNNNQIQTTNSTGHSPRTTPMIVASLNEHGVLVLCEWSPSDATLAQGLNNNELTLQESKLLPFQSKHKQ